MGTATETILIAPSITYQTILGIGSSLEHTSIYAIRKNKTRSQQRALLESLISPDEGIGMNLFRIEIGTSDFSDGTKASPVPLYEKGWFSLKDSPNAPLQHRPSSQPWHHRHGKNGYRGRRGDRKSNQNICLAMEPARLDAREKVDGPRWSDQTKYVG